MHALTTEAVANQRPKKYLATVNAVYKLLSLHYPTWLLNIKWVESIKINTTQPTVELEAMLSAQFTVRIKRQLQFRIVNADLER